MYSDRSAITNPALRPWADFLSDLTTEQITGLQTIHDGAAKIAPPAAAEALTRYEWATAARAICYRTKTDSQDVWRNTTPPDRQPILITFKEEAEPGVYQADGKAAKFDHGYRTFYIGTPEEHGDLLKGFPKITDGQSPHLWLNVVRRVSQEDGGNATVGYELLVMLGDRFVTLYLDNEGGAATDLPKEYREVRVWKEKSVAAAEVAAYTPS